MPLVTFAALRRGSEKSSDYWTVATVLELACLNRDEAVARRCLPRVLMLAVKAHEPWMLKTTARKLEMLAQ